MSLYGNVGYQMWPQGNGQSVQLPMQTQMSVLPVPQNDAAATYPGYNTYPSQLQVPHFTGDKLVIPPGTGLTLSARSGGTPPPSIGATLDRSLGGPNDRKRGLGAGLSSEQFEKLKDEVKKEVEDQQARKEAKLESRWFELPNNTYGTAIWATLVLEMEALNPQFLFKSADSEDVPSDQRWQGEDESLVNWGRLRLSPFLVAWFFMLSCVGLCFISWLVQFGFIYYIDQQIGGGTFFDLENAQYVCSTDGWVQLISVFFFLAFMLGQIPKVAKNIVIITTGSMETDEARGEDGARTLCITPEQLNEARRQHRKRDITSDISAQTLITEAKGIPGILQAALPAMKYIPRTADNLLFRRFVAMTFPLAELAIISYLIYVGVKYIFWSGFTSNEQSDPAHFPDFPSDANTQWPWMSETNGVEEIIMATLALQFIMDIDEGIFEYVLPKSVQNSVAGAKLSCFGWLPAFFRVSDYVMIGKSMAVDNPEPETDQYPLGYERYKVLVDMQKEKPQFMQDPVFLKYFKDAAASTIGECFSELDDWVGARDDDDWWLFKSDAEFYHRNLVDEVDWLLGFYKEFPPDDQEDKLDNYLCLRIKDKLSFVPQHKRIHYWEEEHENITEEFYEALKARPLRLKWLNLLPDATFIFTLFVVVLPITLVLLVRAKMGCFNFGRVEFKDLPADLVGYWDGVVRLIPVFVVFAVLMAWRGWYLARGIWRTSQAEKDSIVEMKQKREQRKQKKEERKTMKEEQKKQEKSQASRPEASVQQPIFSWNNTGKQNNGDGLDKIDEETASQFSLPQSAQRI